MKLFDKKEIIDVPTGNQKKELNDNKTGLLKKVNMLFTDVEKEGKKEGYTKAAAEYEQAFCAIESEYKETMELVEYKKNIYSIQVDVLIDRLEELKCQKANLMKQVMKKTKDVSIKYNIPLSQGLGASGLMSSAVVMNHIPITTIEVLNLVYKHKERKFLEAKRKGYLEAKELYETKIEKLKQDLIELKNKGNDDTQKLYKMINEILDEIAKEQMMIAELQILL
ncbi:hypothetical protein BN3660_03172 [Eubacteriaceae bacterium CHKCI004]|nr:hypothetical protein BN3660_03172 [Eubacteriaceae bacterium CHKCI004]